MSLVTAIQEFINSLAKGEHDKRELELRKRLQSQDLSQRRNLALRKIKQFVQDRRGWPIQEYEENLFNNMTNIEVFQWRDKIDGNNRDINKVMLLGFKLIALLKWIRVQINRGQLLDTTPPLTFELTQSQFDQANKQTQEAMEELYMAKMKRLMSDNEVIALVLAFQNINNIPTLDGKYVEWRADFDNNGMRVPKTQYKKFITDLMVSQQLQLDNCFRTDDDNQEMPTQIPPKNNQNVRDRFRTELRKRNIEQEGTITTGPTGTKVTAFCDHKDTATKTRKPPTPPENPTNDPNKHANVIEEKINDIHTFASRKFIEAKAFHKDICSSLMSFLSNLRYITERMQEEKFNNEFGNKVRNNVEIVLPLLQDMIHITNTQLNLQVEEHECPNKNRNLNRIRDNLDNDIIDDMNQLIIEWIIIKGKIIRNINEINHKLIPIENTFDPTTIDDRVLRKTLTDRLKRSRDIVNRLNNYLNILERNTPNKIVREGDAILEEFMDVSLYRGTPSFERLDAPLEIGREPINLEDLDENNKKTLQGVFDKIIESKNKIDKVALKENDINTLTEVPNELQDVEKSIDNIRNNVMKEGVNDKQKNIVLRVTDEFSKMVNELYNYIILTLKNFGSALSDEIYRALEFFWDISTTLLTIVGSLGLLVIGSRLSTIQKTNIRFSKLRYGLILSSGLIAHRIITRIPFDTRMQTLKLVDHNIQNGDYDIALKTLIVEQASFNMILSRFLYSSSQIAEFNTKLNQQFHLLRNEIDNDELLTKKIIDIKKNLPASATINIGINNILSTIQNYTIGQITDFINSIVKPFTGIEVNFAGIAFTSSGLILLLYIYFPKTPKIGLIPIFLLSIMGISLYYLLQPLQAPNVNFTDIDKMLE